MFATGGPRATTRPANPYGVALVNFLNFFPSCMKIVIRQFMFKKALTWVKMHKVFLFFFAHVAE